MCPSCHSDDVSRSRRRKLKDRFMQWMGKVAYRCRDCHRRFYVSIDVDQRLHQVHKWKKRSAEHVGAAQKPPAHSNDDDPLDGYDEDFEA